MAACVLAALAFAAPAAGQAIVEYPPQDPAVIHWDPAVRHGVLDNGLRYVVMRNAAPTGAVSIRLGVGVGSLDDDADALGEAHFIEHMAFGGSHAQLQPDVEQAFAKFGVAFGRDRNAHTAPSETVYSIDLPHADDAGLDLGFRWLRAVASGARLTAEEVDRERGVIQAEREARLSEMAQALDTFTGFLQPGGPLDRGAAVGTSDSIQHLTAAQLQSFYARWYRPDNAVVTVVGDLPEDELEARVRQAFGDWRRPAGPLTRAKPPPIDEKRGVDAFVFRGSTLPDLLRVCRVRAPVADAGYDVAAMRRAALNDLWVEIARARLARLQESPASGVVQGYVHAEDVPGQFSVACFTGLPTPNGWRPFLASVQRQAQMLLDTPPSEDELETAIKTLRSRLRRDVSPSAVRASSDIADGALAALLRRRAYPSRVEAMRAFDLAVEDLTPAELQKAFRQTWSGAGPLIEMVGAAPPDVADLRQAWGTSQPTETAAASGASQAPTWRYASFGKAGRVVKREALGPDGVIRLTFANGVRLNFKHTDFENDDVEIRVRFGAGRREIANQDYAVATVGAALFDRGGLGQNSLDDIKAIFPEYGVDVKMAVGDDAFAFKAASADSTLPTNLQVLAAYLSDPGFRGLDPLAAIVWRSGFRMALTSPPLMLHETLTDAIAPGNPDSILAAQGAPAPTSADFARILKPALTSSPLEVSLVGDIDEKTAIADVAATFGALPARKDAPQARPDTWFLRFPEHPPALIQGTHHGPAEKAAVAMVWPLYVAEPARRREERALQLVALVYQEALLRRIRGDLGEAYAPSAATEMPDHGDQGLLMATVEVSAANLDGVRAEMGQIGRDIARGAFTDADVETVRKPLLQQLAKMERSNAAWANALSASADRAALDDLEAAPGMIASISAAEVRKAAAQWMASPPIVVVVTKAPEAAGAKQAAAK